MKARVTAAVAAPVGPCALAPLAPVALLFRGLLLVPSVVLLAVSYAAGRQPSR